MGDMPIKAVFKVPALMCAVMMAVGIGLSRVAHVDIGMLFTSYLAAGVGTAFLCVLIFMFGEFAKLARRRAVHPLPVVADAVCRRLVRLALPAVVFPLFLAGFTAAKVATPYVVGYHWDAFWADVDRMIFRDDAWRIAHRIFGSRSVPAWEWVYTVGWGFALAFSTGLGAIYLRPRRLAVFYTAMMGTWLVGGWLLAYCFAAAGPAFAHLADPTLAARFAPLRAELGATLARNGDVQVTQAYLAGAIHSHRAVNGGGISAMPSMHLGAASIYVLLARGTRWMIPALLFWLIIFIGSAYFGYHYWIDGIVAAGVAWTCWSVAESHYEEKAFQRGPLVAQNA